MAFTYVTSQDDELDAICFRYYGRTQGTVEVVLEANRDLANLMPHFDAGVRITLPDISAPSQINRAIRLWD